MKRLSSFSDVNTKQPPFPNNEKTKSTLNGDEIDNKQSIHVNKEKSTDINHASTYDKYDALENISKQDENLAMEAPFQDRHESLARPFIYLKKIYSKNPDTIIGRVMGHINQNINNAVIAENLAQQTQFMILQYVRMNNPRIPIRDDIVTSATNHMVSIYLNIINLFICDLEDPIDKDIEELFTLIIETTYRLQDTMTFNSFDKIDLENIRKIIRELRTYVIKLRNRE